jgi:hypothetical protein
MVHAANLCSSIFAGGRVFRTEIKDVAPLSTFLLDGLPPVDRAPDPFVFPRFRSPSHPQPFNSAAFPTNLRGVVPIFTSLDLPRIAVYAPLLPRRPHISDCTVLQPLGSDSRGLIQPHHEPLPPSSVPIPRSRLPTPPSLPYSRPASIENSTVLRYSTPRGQGRIRQPIAVSDLQNSGSIENSRISRNSMLGGQDLEER